MVGMLDSVPRKEVAKRLYDALSTIYTDLSEIGFEAFYRNATFNHDASNFRYRVEHGFMDLEQRMGEGWVPVALIAPVQYTGLPKSTPPPDEHVVPQLYSPKNSPQSD